MFIVARRSADRLELELAGEWRALRLAEIAAELDTVRLDGARRVTVSTDHVASLDLSGAWQLRELIERLRSAGAEVTVHGPGADTLELIDDALADGSGIPTIDNGTAVAQPVQALGRQVVRRWQDTLAGLDFLGRISVLLPRTFTSLRRLRPTSITRHVYDTGITAIPIVSLIAFLISVILAYMSAQQLRNFGAEVFVVDLVTIGVLRELGVLLTAIIVAGRSGSSFAAEIGAMRLNEEVDALRATGVDPLEVLVLPRIFGLVIALPLLTMIADLVGLTGGAVLCHFLLDMPIAQFMDRADDAIGPTTFWVGIIKAPVFALLIAMAGTYRGMQVRQSSRELGRLTTVAVVESIFLVILADALFAVIFMELDI